MLIEEFKMDSKEARELCKNKTLDELSEYFSIPREQVKKICNKNGLYWKRIHRKKERPFPRDKMIKVLAKDFTYEDIGTVFGISRQRVEQILRGV